MPIYEYQCLECNHKFEVKQSMNDEPVSSCEKCGKPVRKLYNAAGIIFKGSGFYVNDYKGKSDKSAETAQPACSGGCCGCPATGGAE
ncbi:MAG: zinc ribbon domain-containing protein [Spirochaetes bacterium]|nr:zinc ribbon domain-containing protein [Spirochaetota bacterium]